MNSKSRLLDAPSQLSKHLGINTLMHPSKDQGASTQLSTEDSGEGQPASPGPSARTRGIRTPPRARKEIVHVGLVSHILSGCTNKDKVPKLNLYQI